MDSGGWIIRSPIANRSPLSEIRLTTRVCAHNFAPTGRNNPYLTLSDTGGRRETVAAGPSLADLGIGGQSAWMLSWCQILVIIRL